MNTLVLIFISLALGVIGQLVMKAGMNAIGNVSLRDVFSAKIFSIIANPAIFFGIALYAIALLLWLVVLSREEVSFAYPLISIGYVIVAIMAWAFLGETITPLKFLGILLVVGGVYLILLRI